jgi:hypothetical protein
MPKKPGEPSLATDIAICASPLVRIEGRTEGGMDEYVRRMYLKEEEFLEEYLGTVEAAVDLCVSTGNRTTPATSWHEIRVYLRSSTRFTVIRIHFLGGRLAAEIDCDGPSPSLKRMTPSLRRQPP